MIPGLTYISEYITVEQERAYLDQIRIATWNTELKRRTQHYGYKYDYKRRTVDQSLYLGPLPVWLQAIAERLQAEGKTIKVPDQVIVNEYMPGQGIAAHVDCEPCFGKIIVSISLQSGCMFELTSAPEKIELYLGPRSLVLLTAEARYGWRHGIPARDYDIINNTIAMRQRRVSLTFRNVQLNASTL